MCAWRTRCRREREGGETRKFAGMRAERDCKQQTHTRPKQDRGAPNKSELCINFALGRCAFGDKCRFNHDDAAFLAAKPPDLPGRCPFSCLDACPYGASSLLLLLSLLLCVWCLRSARAAAPSFARAVAATVITKTNRANCARSNRHHVPLGQQPRRRRGRRRHHHHNRRRRRHAQPQPAERKVTADPRRAPRGQPLLPRPAAAAGRGGKGRRGAG